MNALTATLFLLVAAGGTATVLARNLRRQTMLFSLYGLLLTMLFVLIGAADVALSELAVGAGALPLMLLVTISSIEHSAKKQK